MKKLCLWAAHLGLGLVLYLLACKEPAAPPAVAPIAVIEKPKAAPLPDYLLAFIKEYDQSFADAMAATQTPGAAIAIVKDSQIVFLQGYGVKKYGTRDAVDAQTVFRIGSLSKGFAGVLTGILVAENQLAWDDPVQKFYPAFTLRDKKQAQRMRITHLLSQTTGLPYHAYTNLIEEGYSINKIVTQYFHKAPLSGKEGQNYSYQNVAFCAIEEVMRGATGKSYQDLLRERIFEPAGMASASCDFEHIAQATNRACPLLGCPADNISPLYYNAAAAGGVNASAADMGEWLKLLLGQKQQIISNATLDSVFAPRISTDKERRVLPGWIGRHDAYYALGWRVLHNEGDTIIYHGGYVNGYRGEIAFNRRDGIGICVLFNASTALGNTCIQDFFEKWRQVRPKE